jgi:hypothetical protein
VFVRRFENDTERLFFTKSDKVTGLGAKELVTDPNDRNSNDRNSKESVSVPAVAVPWMVNGPEKPPIEG